MEKQVAIRAGFQFLTDQVTVTAETWNATWPMFTVPLFEIYGRDFRALTGMQILAIANHVYERDREAYVNWTVAHHQAMVQEGHMIQSGSLDTLDPVGFNDFISMVSTKKHVLTHGQTMAIWVILTHRTLQATDLGTLAPMPVKEDYYPLWQFR